MMKLITALKKLPYAIPFHDNLERVFNVSSLNNWVKDKWSDDITYK